MRNFVQSDSIFTKSKNVKWNKEKEEKGNDKNKTTRITGWLEVECVEWRSYYFSRFTAADFLQWQRELLKKLG